MESKKSPVFWDCCEDETLEHDNIDDAVEELVEQKCEKDISLKELISRLPEEIEVNGFERDEPNVKHLAARTLLYLIEELDEDYCDPNGSKEQQTKEMEAAAATFVEAVLSQYTVWLCHKVCTEKVNTIEWLKGNMPDLFESGEE